MRRENVPKASLIARFIKSVILLFFFAMALVEIDVAKEIVTIGFATVFITLGALTITITIVGGKSFVEKIEDSLEE